LGTLVPISFKGSIFSDLGMKKNLLKYNTLSHKNGPDVMKKIEYQNKDRKYLIIG